MKKLLWLLCSSSLVFSLAACDPQRISELEEGLSTESDVRMKFGEPEQIWQEPNGVRVLEYNRQPEGTVNYMISIGPDSKMTALRQVLSPANFAKITPGMDAQEVRRRLGKPMKMTPFPSEARWHYDWRYQDGPNNSDRKIFTIIFTSDLKVVSTQSVEDPQLRGN
ncbi:MAG: hypothetical protein RIR79_1949 [Pseudomonadota bacterium]|jgi:outer membrane protein assembly factor BamE (lipoprotein component of BamABCDE complex)